MKPRKHPLDSLEASMRDHIERETADNVARGMHPDDARAAALRKFGNVTRAAEDARDVWRIVWLEQLWQDVRYGARTLRTNLGFTLVVILTLALGIGMNTAVFSVLNAVLLRPLPYPDPERLVWISTYEREYNEEFVQEEHYENWASQAQSFEAMAAYETRDITAAVNGIAVRGQIAMVSESFWPLTGVQPALGSLPAPQEPDAVMLSHRTFVQWFQSDPGVIGKAMQVADRQFTIRGVLPASAEFEFPRSLVTVFPNDDVWGYVNVPHFDQPNGVVGKLKPAVGVPAALAELEVIRARDPGKWELEVRVVPLQEKIVGQAARPLWILLVAVGFVLLIACANVANLLLSRASARQKEIAIRASVGAGRMRVLRQFLAESTMLALLGGAAGLLFARGGLTLLVRLVPQAVPRIAEATLDARVLAFALAASVITALMFGFAPAFAVWKINLHDVLKDGARSASAAPSHLRVRKVLVAVELALAVVLLTGAGLMLKSYWRMNTHPPGFEPERILSMRVPLEGNGYFGNLPRQRAYIDELLRRVRSLPGVETVSLRYGGESAGGTMSWDGSPPPGLDHEPMPTLTSSTSAAFLKLMGMRVVRGRWFTDSEAEPVMVINESLARRDFPGQDPLGRRLQGRWTVVGVVADLKYSRLDAETQPEAYFPYIGMSRLDGASVLVKLSNPAAAIAIPKVVSDIDPTQPVFQVRTIEQALSESIAPRRFNLFLLGTFATAALLLALIGIYGVIAYAVAQRTHEIGVRIALGAGTAEVTGMVLRQGMAVAVAGITVGLLAAQALTRLMESLLFDVRPNDPWTFAAVTVALVTTALLACLAPALRAARVDPLTALRHE